MHAMIDEAAIGERELRRVTQVRTAGRVAAGFAVGPDLVLTARQVLSAAEPCEVRGGGYTDWTSAEVVWNGTGSVDAALLRVARPLWSKDPNVGWTRWATPESDPIECVAHGLEQPSADSGIETVTGRVSTTAVNPGRYQVWLPPAQTETATQRHGLVGSVLLSTSGRQVLGVVSSTPAVHRGTRLEAIPAAVLLRDENFAGLVDAGPTTLEHLTDVPRTPLLHRILHNPISPLPAEVPDWRRMLARHQTVPFLDRGDTRARLTQWCTEPRARFAVAVITGDDGAGKARLAAQLCGELAGLGWDTGFCRPTGPGELGSDPALVEVLHPTLLVIDGPEALASDLTGLVSALAGRRHGPPVRLLFLARADASPSGLAETAWWRRLCDGVTDSLALTRPQIVALNQHPLSPADRVLHVNTALSALRAGPESARLLPAMDGDDFRHPLRVHLAALLAARGEDITTTTSVLHTFLEHEIRQWEHHWHNYWQTPIDPAERGFIRQCVALVTLTRPSLAELPILLATLPGRGDRDAERLAQWLIGWFVGPEDTLDFGPDALSEALLARTENLSAVVDSIYRNPAATTEHLTSMMDRLLACADSPAILPVLFALVSEDLDALAARALRHDCAALSDTVDNVIGRLCRDERYAEAFAAMPVAPAPAGPHRELRTTLAGMRTRHLREQAEGHHEELIGSLVDLCVHTAADGRYTEAAHHAHEAIELYEAAGIENADYALSLHHAACCALAYGEPAQAAELAGRATAWYEELAEANPALWNYYADSCVTSALAAFDSGDLLSTVTAISGAVEVVRDSDTDLVDLFESLASLAERVPLNPPHERRPQLPRPIRDRGEAPRRVREAIIDFGDVMSDALRLALPHTNDPTLAAPLVELGVQLVMLQSRELGFAILDTAIDRLRPQTAESDRQLLIRAGLMRCLSVDEDPAAVLGVTAFLRPLVIQTHHRDGGHDRDLAQILEAEGTALAVLGRTIDAIEPLGQSAAWYGQVDGYDAAQAANHLLLGLCLKDSNEYIDALAQIDRAASIYQSLTQTQPEFVSELIGALDQQAMLETMLGRDPRQTLHRAARLRKDTEIELPNDDDNLVSALLGESPWDTTGDPDLSRATAELQRLAGQIESTDPPVPDDLRSYAGMATSVARAHLYAGRADSAVELLDPAQQLVDDRLSDDQPAKILRMSMRAVSGQSHLALGDAGRAINDLTTARGLVPFTDMLPDLYGTLYEIEYSLGRAHLLAGQPVPADKALRRALDACYQLSDRPGVDIARGTVLATLASIVVDIGHADEAMSLAEQAIAVLRDADNADPTLLGTAYQVKAAVLLDLGDHEGCLTVATEAVNQLHQVADRQPLLSALSTELVGICHDVLDNGAAWPMLRESTDTIAAARQGGAATWPGLCVIHATACVHRSELHDQRGETTESVRWLVEALGSLASAGPVRHIAPIMSTMVLPLWLDITQVYDDRAPDAEATRLFRDFGAQTTRLLSMGELELNDAALRVLSALAAMSDSGELPLEALDEYARHLEQLTGDRPAGHTDGAHRAAETPPHSADAAATVSVPAQRTEATPAAEPADITTAPIPRQAPAPANQQQPARQAAPPAAEQTSKAAQLPMDATQQIPRIVDSPPQQSEPQPAHYQGSHTEAAQPQQPRAQAPQPSQPPQAREPQAPAPKPQGPPPRERAAPPPQSSPQPAPPEPRTAERRSSEPPTAQGVARPVPPAPRRADSRSAAAQENPQGGRYSPPSPPPEPTPPGRHEAAKEPEPETEHQTPKQPNGRASAPTAAELASGSSPVLWNAAQALREAGRLDDAAECLQEIVRMGHTDIDRYAQARLALAQTWREAGETDQAIQQIELLLQTTPNLRLRSAGCRIWAQIADDLTDHGQTGPILHALAHISSRAADDAALAAEVGQTFEILAGLWRR